MPENPKTFTVKLAGEQIEGLRELAGYWNKSLDEALRRIAVRGIDLELHMKNYDQRESSVL